MEEVVFLRDVETFPLLRHILSQDKNTKTVQGSKKNPKPYSQFFLESKVAQNEASKGIFELRTTCIFNSQTLLDIPLHK